MKQLLEYKLTSFPLANFCCNCSGLWLVQTQSDTCGRKGRNDPDHALTKCRLERKRKVANKMRSLRASKGINAKPPAKQESLSGKDEEPTDSQMNSFTMKAIDVGHQCNSRVVGTEEVSNMKLFPK